MLAAFVQATVVSCIILVAKKATGLSATAVYSVQMWSVGMVCIED